MEALPKDLAAIHARWAPVETRAAEIRQSIRRACGDRLPGESHNGANERQVEEFITKLNEDLPGRTYEILRRPLAASTGIAVFAPSPAVWEEARGRSGAPCVVIERQRLSPWAVRTTRWNFVFTVPGESLEAVLLVAHYDSWRGPGADDNTTGEEILKQYLLSDLVAAERPRLTHVYFLAGSEECGLIGLVSQFLLALGLNAGVLAIQQRSWWLAGVALALLPLTGYRFGVSGSREYVRTLERTELQRLRAVVSLDSVGEGRLFIPRSTMGADFLHSVVPFRNYDAFTDLLEEGAHLHGIKYNSYLAGGTTDHVSFMEIRNGFWARFVEALRRLGATLARRSYQPPQRIPASALIAMQPGKASPIVWGGKIHTPRDLPDRVYAEPLCEALLVTDYLFHIAEGGERVAEPRRLDELHYARLYEIPTPEAPEYWLALKDAIEPNRRNLNMVYRVDAQIEKTTRKAAVEVRGVVGWGVDTRLSEDVAELAAARGFRFRQVCVEHLTVRRGEELYVYARLPSLARELRRGADRALAWLERSMGRFSFLTLFAAAYLLAQIVGRSLEFALGRWTWFDTAFLRYPALSIPLVVAVHLGALVFVMIRLIPTWIDNHYWHENRADNMGSLRRWAVSRRPSP